MILYNNRGFKIETIPSDPELGPYKDEIRKKFEITLKLASKGGNVTEVEQHIITLK